MDSSAADQTAALIRGVCPVLQTPFHAGGDLDEHGFDTVVDHVIATGISAVMFPGFASEHAKLDDDERRRLTLRLLGITKGRSVAVIISVAQHGTLSAVRAARQAIDDGADAINLLPPHQLRPPLREVIDHLRAVLAALAPAPMIVQYAPAETGTALDAATLLELRDENSNLRMVKVEARPPGPLIAALSAAARPLPSLVGYAGMLLPDAVRRGAIGVQPGCSFIELYTDIWKAYAAGDHDRGDRLHAEVLPYLAYWMQNVELLVAVEKLISFRRGLIQSPYCRRPSWQLDHQEGEQVERFLDQFSERLASHPRTPSGVTLRAAHPHPPRT